MSLHPCPSVCALQRERTFAFQFPSCEKVPPPVLPFINVSFSYQNDMNNLLYKVRVCVLNFTRLLTRSLDAASKVQQVQAVALAKEALVTSSS